MEKSSSDKGRRERALVALFLVFVILFVGTVGYVDYKLIPAYEAKIAGYQAEIARYATKLGEMGSLNTPPIIYQKMGNLPGAHNWIVLWFYEGSLTCGTVVKTMKLQFNSQDVGNDCYYGQDLYVVTFNAQDRDTVMQKLTIVAYLLVFDGYTLTRVYYWDR